MYEDPLYYHNTITRYKKFPQPIKGEGLDSSFDASAEVLILAEFLEKFPSFKKDQLYASISRMSLDITKAITTSGRKLSTPMKDPENRRRFPQIDHKKFYQSASVLALASASVLASASAPTPVPAPISAPIPVMSTSIPKE